MLNTTYSPYWLILCLLIGVAYAYALYSRKKEPWTPIWNKVLFVLRFLVVSIIGYLFLEPYVSIQKTTSESSQIIFLWDDSESISKSVDDLQSQWQQLQKTSSDLQEEKEVDVRIIGLSGNELSTQDSVKNDREISPLNTAIQNISKTYDNRLVSEVVLFSDGIYNQGIAPDYYAFPFQVSTVGLGDTTQKRDLVLQQLSYNKVAYEGNQFPIKADILQSGFDGETTQVLLKNNGKILERKSIRFKGAKDVTSVQFLVDASGTGLQDYEVEVKVLSHEFNTQNNRKNAYVNVVEGKKDILLLSPYPHPDIKALAAAIDGNENYTFTLAIDKISENAIEKTADYDLVILFHLPNRTNSFDAEITKLKDARTPLWFITGSHLDIKKHNALNESVKLSPSSETDEAFAYFNPNFDLFEIESEQKENLEKLPPVFMPFAKHNFHPRSKTLLMKKVGNVETQQPVFVFYDNNEVKQATLLVQNFRIWRMIEYLNTEKQELFDGWVMKTIRYLTADNQKDRFKVFPTKEAFSDNDEVKFQVELYNEVFDRIYGTPVSLALQNTSSNRTLNYEFTPDRLQPDFEIGSLEGGVYKYTASTSVQGNKFQSKGQFVVDQFDMESQNLQADFNLLKRLAAKNRGKFFHSNEHEKMTDYLLAKDYPKVLSGESETIPLTQNYLPYLLIFGLVFAEWFIRRYFGSY